MIWDEETAVLIDAGMPGMAGQIREAMSRAGVPFDRLKAVILTHQDIDHIGSLPEILEEAGERIEVYAHELDQPYIEGDLPLIKTDLSRIGKGLEALPEKVKNSIIALCENPPKAKVNHVLEHGQVLPFCGGVQVLFTPGHTPGHISLYLQRSKTLIAGDAIEAVNGSLKAPHPHNTPDMETALRSLEQLRELEVDLVICYHGECAGGIFHPSCRNCWNTPAKPITETGIEPLKAAVQNSP
ncbi:MBL fold metallo-hydrolase [Paenibacillus sp. P25]|nr:MBL fold metallo-hydrolase [Paenibacillus sp. P25]